MEKALILTLLVVLVSGCASDSPAVVPLAGDNQAAFGDMVQIKSQLQNAIASGGISPESYEEINGKIMQFESMGYDTAEIRQMLSRLSVGGMTSGDNSSQQGVSDGQSSSRLPVLKNLGVNFGRWDPATNRAGDFLILEGTYGEKIIVEFGLLVNGANGAKRLPELTYSIPVGTPVVSPIDGIVDRIDVIEWSQDYAVQLKTDKNEEWMVGYEHLVNLRVAEGDAVIAGQVIGEAAPYTGNGFAELVVWKGGATESDIIKHCPFDALDESLKPSYSEKINRLISDWEEYKGKDIYNEEEWVMPGCLLAEMTEAEAMNPGNQTQQGSAETSRIVIWQYRDGKWTPTGDPPDCPDPLALQAPVDMTLPTSVLYPGQARNGDFKPHGGFRIDGKSGPVEVTAPLQGYIYNVARFYDEFGIHYMFDVQHPCGIMYRLGHLGAVPPKLEAIFENMSFPEKGDSRTHEIEPVFIELGETIATDTQHGSGFDWGVYDLRKENVASQDPAFREAHKDEPWQVYYAVCWFNYLPADQEQIVRSLPAADGISGKTSAYC